MRAKKFTVKTACLLTVISVILACYFHSYVRAGDAITSDPTGRGEGYSAVLYNNMNGLPTSEANDIEETSEGFIWIGSYSGLIRYDGNTFDRIDSTTGIASVVSLFTDSRDRLWVGTNDNGAAVMENGEFRMYGKDDGLKSASIRDFAEDDSGRIYIATTHGLAYVNEDGGIVTIDVPLINDTYIRMLQTGEHDMIYGLTMDGDIFTVRNGALMAFYDHTRLDISDIHAIYPDPERPGFLYAGTKNSELIYGELRTGFEDAVIYDASPLEYINSVKKFGDDIWICADNGVGRLEHDGVHMLDNVPLTRSVDDMMSDYQGNLWFVSSRQGVMKIVPNRFTDMFFEYGLPEAVVNSTCLADGMLFIGADTGLTVLGLGEVIDSIPLTGAATASGQELEYTDLIDMMRGVRIRTIIQDQSGRIWFATYGDNALTVYDHGQVTVYNTDSGLPSDRVRTVTEGSDGTIMVACTGGLVLIRGNEIIDTYDESSGITNTEILTVCGTDNGQIILGTDGAGIYIIDDAGILHLGSDNGLTSEVILRIKKDISRDIYWIVTSNAIAYMDQDFQITTVRQFPYSNNFDLFENSRGEMWVLSSNGIYVADVEQMLAAGDIDTVFYRRDNGLSCIATSNSYSYLSGGGNLYIAGTTGVCKVNIDTPFEDDIDIKMAVPFIDADGVRIYPDDEGIYIVPSDVRKVTIYGCVFTYTQMNPLVTYRLTGFDSDVTTLRRNDMTPIDYTNLRGGTYRFEMWLGDRPEETGEKVSVVIIKQKTIYETWWFRTCYILLGLAIIALIVSAYVRMKTKALLKKEQENKILIREIVEAFAKTIDMKDRYTKGHSSRVAEYTALLAKELGYSQDDVDKYYNIALLHDIGKIGIPPSVLNKEGKLDDSEFAMIKSHSSLGYNVLKDISIMPELATGAGSHHERPDGKGYPKGLKGEEIPRVAQLIAVADTFDAMYSDRPYRKRMNFDKVVSIMKEVSGTQLASDVVDAFLRLVDKGYFKDPEDNGGGSTEDIDNIHKRQNKDEENNK